MTSRFNFLLIALLSMTVAPGRAHASRASKSVDESVAPPLSAVRPEKRDSVLIGNLRWQLRTGDAEGALRTYYGDAFDPSLADVVVYLRSEADHSVVRATQNHRIVRKFSGARFAWVVVFMDGKRFFDASTKKTTEVRPKTTQVSGTSFPGTKESAAKATTTFEYVTSQETASVRIEPLDDRRSVVESVILQGLVGLLGEKKFPAGENSTDAKEETKPLPLTNIGGQGGDSLYYGYAKFELKENSINRFRVAAANERAYTTIPNYSRSIAGLSVSTMVSLPARQTAHVQDAAVDAYLLFHAYWFMKPEQPRMEGVSNRSGLGMFAGAGIPDGLTKMTVGISSDHWFRELGFVGGLTFRRLDEAGRRRRWITGIGIGLNYSL